MPRTEIKHLLQGEARRPDKHLIDICELHTAGFICRHPWLLAWPCAANLGLSAARPPTLRVCARAVRARPVHQPARAAKASLQRQPNSHRTPPTTVSQSLHQQPTASSVHMAGQPRKPTDRRRRPSQSLTPERGPLTPPRRTTWSGTPRPPW